MNNTDVFVTRHAIVRMYERNHISSDIFDNSQLIQEVLDEFYKSKLVRQDLVRGDIYKNDNFTIITEFNKDENVNTIITIYPNGEKPQQEEKVIMNNVDFKNIKLIKHLLNNDELIILKHMGSKKLLLLNDLVVLARIENNRGKVYINIMIKWEIELFKDKNFLENFKAEYYSDISQVIWIKFLQMIGIYDYVFRVEKIKETRYSSEVQIYKEVLAGDIKRFPSRFWEDDIGGNDHPASKECVRYLIEEYLKWDIFDIYKNFNSAFFRKYKLGGMVNVVFNDKSYSAIKNAYPELMIWRFKKYKNTEYWKVENDGIAHAKEAIEWLIIETEEYKINLNKSSIMSINWYEMLKKYNMEKIIVTTFKYDYKSFFKDIFNINFSDEECIRYYEKTYYNDDNKSTFVKTHR
jgi:hypothetical protein